MKSSMASVTTSNVVYDAATGKFEWKAQWGNLVTMFDNLQGQASKYKHLKLKIDAPSGRYRLQVREKAVLLPFCLLTLPLRLMTLRL